MSVDESHTLREPECVNESKPLREPKEKNEPTLWREPNFESICPAEVHRDFYLSLRNRVLLPLLSPLTGNRAKELVSLSIYRNPAV